MIDLKKQGYWFELEEVRQGECSFVREWPPSPFEPGYYRGDDE